MRTTWVLVLLGISATGVGAAETDFATALLGGKPRLNLRVRLEDVRDDAFAVDATAPTFRARLGYESLPWHSMTLLVEVDHLGVWGGEAYNSTRNGRINRPQITDPPGTDLNQAALKFSTSHEEWVLGRQRLSFDNQRIIGGSAWRQNEQTFDAVTIKTRRIPRTQVTYSYLDNVNRVFGPDSGSPPPDLRLHGHLLHAAVDLAKAGKLSAFAQRFDVITTPALGHQNLGITWSGSHVANKTWSIPWLVSFVSQSDAGRNPTDYRANYVRADLGVTRQSFGVRAGLEVLAGDPTRGEHRFQTPLATLHLFQGWADKFLTTPTQGVRDRFIDVSARHWGLEANLVWHDFQADAGPQDYGREWDFSVSRKFGKRHELLLKGANYQARGLGSDTRKLWLQFNADFQ